MSSTKLAVILLNFGGPKNLEEVPGFLFEILRDPNVIQLPVPLSLQDRFAKFIANKRASFVQDQYQAIGGKSPIVESTKYQCDQLQKALEERGIEIPVYVIHRYIPGDTETVISQILQEGRNFLYLIPMYPHYSWATSGSAFERVQVVLQSQKYKGNVSALRSYPNHPLYIGALEDKINQTLERHQLTSETTVILCTAHGLPSAYVKKGDPYLIELLLTLEELRQRFSSWTVELSFQSRVGPAQWLEPYTEDIISQIAAKGVQALVFVGISFVNDHLETLYEIDHTYFEIAKKVGLTPYRVPAIEAHPLYIKLLCEKIITWNQTKHGMDVSLLSPPSQNNRRYDQWILYAWLLSLLVALYAAIV